MQVFFLNTLRNYSIVKHIKWIDFNNFKVLQVCSVHLNYLGKRSVGLGLRISRYSVLNDLNQIGLHLHVSTITML